MLRNNIKGFSKDIHKGVLLFFNQLIENNDHICFTHAFFQINIKAAPLQQFQPSKETNLKK